MKTPKFAALCIYASLATALAASLAVAAPAKPAPSRALDRKKLSQFLLDDAPIFNLKQMDADPKLRARSVSRRPWTASFLPALMGYSGAMNNGQTDADVFFSKYFPAGYDHFINTRMQQLRDFKRTGYMSQGDLETLSPSEKYDLIIGMLGSDQSLTFRLWAKAKQGHDRDGLTFWTGMCHGWGPASIIFPRPERRVFVPTADGRFRVPFYPEDIKQLATTLYAMQANIETEMVPDKYNQLGKMPILGVRCNQKTLAHDAGGFILEPTCEDVMPHDWHVAIVNSIGVNDQAIIADIGGGHPIDNFPIWAYRYGYFNPVTGKDGSLAASTVAISAYRNDPMARHRSPLARSVVGIRMQSWATDHHPSDHATENSVKDDKVRTLKYVYDLELDERGDIVGGQWRDSDLENHPDFIWYPPKGITKSERAILPSAGPYDSTRLGLTGQYDLDATGEWNPSQPVPATWREPARKAAGVSVSILDMKNVSYNEIRPMPLGKIVWGLIEQASSVVAAPPAPGAPSTAAMVPVIQAKASLQTGIFAFDERCNYVIAPTSPSPVLYEMPYVSNGRPLPATASFTFWAASRRDGRVDAWVRSRVTYRNRRDPGASRTQHVVLTRGKTETVDVDFWYGEGFGKMLNHYAVELTYDGKSAPAPALPSRLACGQIFL